MTHSLRSFESAQAKRFWPQLVLQILSTQNQQDRNNKITLPHVIPTKTCQDVFGDNVLHILRIYLTYILTFHLYLAFNLANILTWHSI